ncbi:MAG: acyl-CoA thioesterase [Gammaproteobacteria bacterium]|nr:acyl-CoA thioesterase [Gammaproteobacteria bacterium]MBU1654459.1 acyl-CoA thioesterase [Gammaproteobacteria bacterium]MBU1962617.1 acyl-CoA thioesterase [Gammaproteobacteria bacterium]
MNPPPNPPFHHRISIPFQDVDLAGMVFFAHFFRYAHETYEIFMTAIGHPLDGILREAVFALPLVHAEADYKKPLRLGDTTLIELSLKRLGESSFSLHYLFRGGDGEPRATAETVHVALDVELGRPCAIPARLRDALKPYEKTNI